MKKSSVYTFGCHVVPLKGTHTEKRNYTLNIVYKSNLLEVIA
ncbi:MAG: hypothetical protein PVF58_07255 [Candidatus Methanofastidiosia archaeon]